MSKPETLILTDEDTRKLVSISEAIPLVEEVFKLKGIGKAEMPPKLYLTLPERKGDLRVMPGYLPPLDALSVKTVTVYPNNPLAYHLPTVIATIILLDPATGLPLAVMGGTWITLVRTAAAGAVAAKWLARRGSSTIGLIGAGRQGWGQIQGLLEVLDSVEEIRIFDLRSKASYSLAETLKDKVPKVKPVGSAREAVEDSDILVTATPSRSPIVESRWVRPGMHITCIGADAPGKQELDPEILKEAKIVVDDFEQGIHSGELNVPVSRRLVKPTIIYGELGEIVAGLKPGRESEEEITIFTSTGLAIQDTGVARYVYRKALEERIGFYVKLSV